MISGLPIPIKISPRFDVMNIKSIADFLLSNTASLASKVISLTCRSALFAPTWTASVFMTTKPSWTILPACITRLPLPLKATFSITKNKFSHTAGQAKDRCTTIITVVLSTLFVLNVIPSAGRRVNFPILLIALTRAKGKVKFFIPAPFSFSCFSTKGAISNNFSCTCFVSAISRAELLIEMITGWQEQIPAMFTGFVDAFRLILIEAVNRAKLNFSICSFFDWIAANKARFHSMIISWDRGMHNIRKSSLEYLHLVRETAGVAE